MERTAFSSQSAAASNITEDVTDGFRMFEIVSNALIAILGVPGNLTGLIIIASNKSLRTVQHALIANLVVADLLVCGVVCPAKAYMSLAGSSSLACEFFGATTVALPCLSVFSLGAIACSRYVLICLPPNYYERVFSGRNVGVITICLWLVSVALAAPPLLGHGRYEYNLRVRQCYLAASDGRTYLSTMEFIAACFVPAASAMVFSYGKVFWHFRKSQRRIAVAAATSRATGGVSMLPSVEGEVSRPPLPRSSSLTNRIRCCLLQQRALHPATHTHTGGHHKAYTVTFNLVKLSALFFACWSPVAALHTIDRSGEVPATWYSCLASLGYFHSALNIFLYSSLNPTFRLAYRNCLRCDVAGAPHTTT